MYQLVFLQITLLTECFITNITGIRMLATMSKMVCHYMILTNEGLITHITGIRT